ncbi:hypothetical protein [Rhodospirillum centenum]|uniref:Uncharacterized protein n=1 Tax=Rhodospirillum centenum (strain ATCC 51521 / SW) TaxID=414684 RepID=B6IMP0_RHOCS|nr:hypothetical protein [Rhodospirillum centenum]ACI98706.1 hypothetical protein RC1_1300 [Rhodospirillum centenum SW]
MASRPKFPLDEELNELANRAVKELPKSMLRALLLYIEILAAPDGAAAAVIAEKAVAKVRGRHG